MDQHTAQVIFQVLMARAPEFLAGVSKEVAVALQQDRLNKITYQQALQQASCIFVQSLCRTDLTAETAFEPLVFELPANETDVIAVEWFEFSKRHFANNVFRYAPEVNRFYIQQYKDLQVGSVGFQVNETGIVLTLKPADNIVA
jgi:hypothetical protein